MAYSQEVAESICQQIADGKSLRAICAADDMPDKATVFRWLEANAEFRDRYARAREAQADAIFDECLAIADSQEGDVIKVDGVDQVNHDVIARARLRIDTRKWMAGKLRPKVYGDKLELAVATPPDEDAIDAAIAAKLAAMASGGQGGAS